MSQIVRIRRSLLFVEICWVSCIPERLVYIFSCNHYVPLQGRPVNCEGEVKFEWTGTQTQVFLFQSLGCSWSLGLLVPDFSHCPLALNPRELRGNDVFWSWWVWCLHNTPRMQRSRGQRLTQAHRAGFSFRTRDTQGMVNLCVCVERAWL